MKKTLHKITIICLFILITPGLGQTQTQDKLSFHCPPLPQSTTTPTPRSLAMADSLAKEAIIPLDVETEARIAKVNSRSRQSTKADSARVRAFFGLLGAVHGSLHRYAGIPSQDKLEKALADLQQALLLNPDLVPALHSIALIAARGGHDYACAEALYLRALQIEPANAIIHFDYAELIAADEGDEWLRWLNLDPHWKRIRNDPRFKKVLERTGG